MRIVELKGFKGICMTDDNGNYYELRKIEVEEQKDSLEDKIVKFIKNLEVTEMLKESLFNLLKKEFGGNNVMLGVTLNKLGYKHKRKKYTVNGKKINGKAFYYNLSK